MLTRDQLDFYNANGYLLLKDAISAAEAAECRAECHALAERLSAHSSIDATWGSARQLAGGADAKILHCHDVQFYSARLTRLISDERIVGPAADFIGSPNVQLHHTKMFIKPPEKGAPFPMHQDHPYFPHDRDTMIAAICFFDRAPEEKGCVRVVPGSHKLGPLEHSSQGGWHLPFEQYPLESAVPCPAEAGDVLYFSYLTIHGSGVNTSDEARTTLLIQMRDPTDPPSVQTHLSRGQGMMLRGVDPLTERPSSAS